jgi:phage shock protein A
MTLRSKVALHAAAWQEEHDRLLALENRIAQLELRLKETRSKLLDVLAATAEDGPFVVDVSTSGIRSARKGPSP